MSTLFKSVKTDQVFYDLQSKAFFKKRNKTTAAMLHHGQDLDFEGDTFDADDIVQVIDVDTLQVLQADTQVSAQYNGLHFDGSIPEAMSLLDSFDRLLGKTNAAPDIAEFVHALRASLGVVAGAALPVEAITEDNAS